MPKQLTIAQAQQQLPSLSEQLTNEPIIITQDGVPVIAALSYQHLSELMETLDILSDQDFVAQLRQSLTQAEQNLMVSWDDVKTQLSIA
jgi:antitoxin YefM